MLFGLALLCAITPIGIFAQDGIHEFKDGDVLQAAPLNTNFRTLHNEVSRLTSRLEQLESQFAKQRQVEVGQLPTNAHDATNFVADGRELPIPRNTVTARNTAVYRITTYCTVRAPNAQGGDDQFHASVAIASLGKDSGFSEPGVLMSRPGSLAIGGADTPEQLQVSVDAVLLARLEKGKQYCFYVIAEGGQGHGQRAPNLCFSRRSPIIVEQLTDGE